MANEGVAVALGDLSRLSQMALVVFKADFVLGKLFDTTLERCLGERQHRFFDLIERPLRLGELDLMTLHRVFGRPPAEPGRLQADERGIDVANLPPDRRGSRR